MDSDPTRNEPPAAKQAGSSNGARLLALAVALTMLAVGLAFAVLIARASRGGRGTAQGETAAPFPAHPGRTTPGRRPRQDDRPLRRLRPAEQEKVLAAWQTAYDQQKKRNPWPEALGDDFRQMIERLGAGQEIPVAHRERYQAVVREHFPEMLVRMGVRSPGGLTDVDRRDPPEGSGARSTGTVPWGLLDGETLESRFLWASCPTDSQVRAAQEDLWVCQSLLGVVRRTNERATGRHRPDVKAIVALQIAEDAQPAFAGAGIGRQDTGPTDDYRGWSPYNVPERPGRSPWYGQPTRRATPRGRYVDPTGSPQPPGEPPAFAEFKMIPFHLKAVMDQRGLGPMVAACDETAMPVEVRLVEVGLSGSRRVRVARISTTPGSPRGAWSDSRSTDGRNTNHRGQDSPWAEGRDDRENLLESSPQEALVDLWGVAYVFNAPDQGRLGTGSAGAPASLPGTGHGAEVPGPLRWLRTDWDEAGVSRREGQYTLGRPSGTWTFWHSNGTRLAEGIASDADFSHWAFWTADGREVRCQDVPDLLRKAKAALQPTADGPFAF